jgi:Protein of unknown function (DUF3072)
MTTTGKPPTAGQLRYLRSLATQRGESFGYPRSSAEASAEIERLKGRRRQSPVERFIELDRVGGEVAEIGDAASVREDEVVGYGSSARWR